MRSLRNRLAVIFALIILGAIGTIYLSVTPRLEDSLTTQRLDQVRAASELLSPDLGNYLPPRKDPVLVKGTNKTDSDATKKLRDDKVSRFAERFNTELLLMAVKPA